MELISITNISKNIPEVTTNFTGKYYYDLENFGFLSIQTKNIDDLGNIYSSSKVIETRSRAPNVIASMNDTNLIFMNTYYRNAIKTEHINYYKSDIKRNFSHIISYPSNKDYLTVGIKSYILLAKTLDNTLYRSYDYGYTWELFTDYNTNYIIVDNLKWLPQNGYIGCMAYDKRNNNIVTFYAWYAYDNRYLTEIQPLNAKYLNFEEEDSNTILIISSVYPKHNNTIGYNTLSRLTILDTTYNDIKDEYNIQNLTVINKIINETGRSNKFLIQGKANTYNIPFHTLYTTGGKNFVVSTIPSGIVISDYMYNNPIDIVLMSDLHTIFTFWGPSTTSSNLNFRRSFRAHSSTSYKTSTIAACPFDIENNGLVDNAISVTDTIGNTRITLLFGSWKGAGNRQPEIYMEQGSTNAWGRFYIYPNPNNQNEVRFNTASFIGKF